MRANFYTSEDMCLLNNVRRKNNSFVVIMAGIIPSTFLGPLNNRNTQS